MIGIASITTDLAVAKSLIDKVSSSSSFKADGNGHNRILELLVFSTNDVRPLRAGLGEILKICTSLS